jgi:hypothetical protein
MCEIIYVHTGRFLDRSIHYYDNSEDEDEDERKDEDVREHAEFPTDILNNLLVTLGKNYALNIKRYARYGRLLHSIEMQDIVGVLNSFLSYHPTNLSYSEDHYRYIIVLDRGKRVKWERKEGPALLNMPGPAKYLIHTYACTSDEVVLFDLDSKKAPGLSLGQRGVNKQLRGDASIFGTWAHNQFALKMTSRKATTDFDNFRALKFWMDMEPFKGMIKTPASFTDVVLRFELPTSIRFGNLCINISTLLRLLPDLEGYCVIILSDPNTTEESSVRVLWRDLQRAVFLLSDILDQRPSKEDQPIPQIWIDGHGDLLRATYPATATSDEFYIPHDYGVREEGYKRIREIEKYRGPLDQRYPHQYSQLQIKPDCLIRIRMLLRDSH